MSAKSIPGAGCQGVVNPGHADGTDIAKCLSTKNVNPRIFIWRSRATRVEQGRFIPAPNLPDAQEVIYEAGRPIPVLDQSGFFIVGWSPVEEDQSFVDWVRCSKGVRGEGGSDLRASRSAHRGGSRGPCPLSHPGG